MSRILIGVTGNVASGKSVVARHFQEKGCALVDADKVAHELYATNTGLLRQLASIRCVSDTEKGAQAGGEWITTEAYYRDGRGGRRDGVDPRQPASPPAGRRPGASAAGRCGCRG